MVVGVRVVVSMEKREAMVVYDGAMGRREGRDKSDVVWVCCGQEVT